MIPAIRDWVIEQRLWRLYTELRDVEAVITSGSDGGAGRLAELEKKVNLVRVPKRFARVLYTLKQHVALVRERLRGVK